MGNPFHAFVALIGVSSFIFSAAVPADGQARSARALSEQVLLNRMKSEPGKWNYKTGFILYAAFRVWQRTHDQRTFDWITTWLDAHWTQADSIHTELDDVLPGLTFICLYEETGDPRYKTAAMTIRQKFATYPRTSDGAFIHRDVVHDQLWADGAFMSLPFLARYGAVFGDTSFGQTEAARQLVLYAQHLQHPENGLLIHGWDEDGSASWADPLTHLSPVYWGRAMGWYAMALVEVLDLLPVDHPDRAPLLAVLQKLIGGLGRFQDPDTGLWYQIIDQPEQAGNWLESSCSMMFVYAIARAAHHGYLPQDRLEMAAKGYEGILAYKFRCDPDGNTAVLDISAGTDVGLLSYYLARGRETNGIRGLPAFLLMCEEMAGDEQVVDKKSGSTQ
jgi:unsaturated rhamnogalacturonyl hydrolase